jgi:hypothetical protein
MSRIYLGGEGDSIPLEALPDPTAGDLPPLRVLYDASGDFDKTDFVSLGYTHWEAYAIGAMGGDGGRIGDSYNLLFTDVQTRPVMTAGEWANYKQLMSIYASMLSPPYGPYLPGQDEASLFAYLESQHPAHNPYYRHTLSAPTLVPVANQYGGAGGGGGLHLGAGLLADLSDLTPVVVGVQGADGEVGQDQVNGVWTPLPWQLRPTSQGGLIWTPPVGTLQTLNNWATNFQYVYPLPHADFDPPTAGSDGGASSFGGTLVRASGGKGGKPVKTWVGAVLTDDRAGGEGGEGDSTTAGGGAAGSTSPANGSDGTWDGVVGQGGGGGRGGSSPTGASSGGQGSYSFADTSVYGNRGVRDIYIPGGGGGAKVGSYKYGGAAVGWDPDGAVIIRLTAPV